MRNLALSCAVFALGTSLGAQPQVPAESQPPVFRSGASLVALNVTVTDRESRYVTGLSADDFLVYEDGIPQKVAFFESTGVPIDLILLIDTSSSMHDKMDLVQKAGVGVVRRLRPADRGAVVSFNDTVCVVQGLTSDADALETAVRATRGKGGTALHNAIYVALKQFGQSAKVTGEVRRQAIAVLSDGVDTASLISFEDLMETAQQTGVGVYPIALESPSYAAREAEAAEAGRQFSETHYTMRKLAQDTGAQAFFPKNVTELDGIYTAIADELAHQYSLGYSPSNRRPDGRYRRITVRIDSQPELRPRTRTGYLAELARPAARAIRQDR